MSSITAAPRIVRAAVVASAPSSISTADVMPTLVATSAAPRNTLVSALLPISSPSREAGCERDDDAEPADAQRDRADVAHVRQPRLEPDPEQQEHDPQLGEDLEHLVRLDEAEHGRPDHDAGEDLADDRGLADALEQLVPELRREQHREQRRQRVGDAGVRSDDRHAGRPCSPSTSCAIVRDSTDARRSSTRPPSPSRAHRCRF